MAEETSSEPSFTWINRMICVYCKHRVGAPHRDGWNEGCGLRYTPSKGYARLELGRKHVEELKSKYHIDAVNELEGCDKFEASGLPAHPRVLVEMIKANPLTSTIPSDEKALETSWDLEFKSQRFLPEENFSKRLEDVQ